MGHYRLTIKDGGYEPPFAFTVKGVMEGFMLREYGTHWHITTHSRKRRLEFDFPDESRLGALVAELSSKQHLEKFRYEIEKL
ncbi:MAG: hypothetical protein WC613_02675 [Candidatus Aenigmatarchaeota archaeon]